MNDLDGNPYLKTGEAVLKFKDGILWMIFDDGSYVDFKEIYGDIGLQPYIHTQNTQSLTWIVNHNFGRLPTSHRILINGTEEAIGEFTDNNLYTSTITFLSPASGKAIIF